MCVTDTQNHVTLLTLKTPTSYFVVVSIILVDRNVNDAVQVSFKKLGVSLKLTIPSLANVSGILRNLLRLFILLTVFYTIAACNCFGHADECEYNPDIDRLGHSLDINGLYEGGGVCQNCRHNTQGINCNQCKPKFFRPYDKPLNATDVCQRKLI